MAKRNLYKDYSPQIREIRKSRNKKLYVDLALKLNRQINQRFYRLEKAGVGINDTAYRYAQNETGKEKPRYTTSRNVLNKMSLDELWSNLVFVNHKLKSETSTISGVKKLAKKRVERALEVLSEDIDDIAIIDRDSFSAFLENGGGDILNSRYYDSTQLIDDWLDATVNTRISNKEFLREIKRFKDRDTFNYAKFKKNVKRLKQRKK